MWQEAGAMGRKPRVMCRQAGVMCPVVEGDVMKGGGDVFSGGG